MHKSYLTPNEVAEKLMVSPITVRQWAQKGWLKAEMTAGGHRRFLIQEVRRFAKERGLTLQLSHGDGLRVLVVDDDQQLAGFLKELLIGHPGISAVEVASEGFEAGRRVHAVEPHVVLLDLMMPGLDGFSVCERLKQDPSTKAIRIVAMTGYASDENVNRIMAAGAEACLSKPFKDTELFQAMGLDLEQDQPG